MAWFMVNSSLVPRPRAPPGENGLVNEVEWPTCMMTSRTRAGVKLQRRAIQSFRQTEKSREFICRVTSYFGRMAATGGNVSERYKREHRQIVVGENGQ